MTILVLISRFYVMETMKDWYRGGDPNQKVPKLLVGLFGGNVYWIMHGTHENQVDITSSNV